MSSWSTAKVDLLDTRGEGTLSIITKRLSESESEKITQHIDAGVDGIGQILGNF